MPPTPVSAPAASTGARRRRALAQARPKGSGAVPVAKRRNCDGGGREEPEAPIRGMSRRVGADRAPERRSRPTVRQVRRAERGTSGTPSTVVEQPLPLSRQSAGTLPQSGESTPPGRQRDPHARVWWTRARIRPECRRAPNIRPPFRPARDVRSPRFRGDLLHLVTGLLRQPAD
jgi:hypothetical protein